MNRMLLLMVVSMTTALHGQDESPLARRFDLVVRRTIPRSYREEVVLPAKRQQEMQRWAYDKTRITVVYLVKENAETAHQAFHERLASIAVGKRRVEGFGDEAYEIAPYAPSGERRLNFRRGRVIVEVEALGDEVTKRLASLFLNEVDRSLVAGELDSR
jgi:hypothetical protein